MIEFDGEFFNLKCVGRITPMPKFNQFILYDTNLNMIKQWKLDTEEEYRIELINLRNAIYGERQKGEVF